MTIEKTLRGFNLNYMMHQGHQGLTTVSEMVHDEKTLLKRMVQLKVPDKDIIIGIAELTTNKNVKKAEYGDFNHTFMFCS